MNTMEKQKSKYGIVEIMPNGNIFGYVNVSKCTSERELEVMHDYIDMGYLPISSTYSISGGKIDSIDFRYMDEDGIPQEGDMPYVNHGVMIMKTKLKLHVPTKDK